MDCKDREKGGDKGRLKGLPSLSLWEGKALGARWPFTGVSWALQARNPKKSEKSLPGPPGPGPPESLQKVSKKSFRDFFETFSRLSGAPRGPRGRRPRETFVRLFRGFGLGGPERPL